jgi:hypothetical protein
MAKEMAEKRIRGRYFKSWKIYVQKEMRLLIFTRSKMQRKMRRAVQKWFKHMIRAVQRRRRAIFAEVMGAYAIKARCFARVKLYNYVNRRINRCSGAHDRIAKSVAQGMSHIREFKRLRGRRDYIIRWRNQVRMDV